MKNLFKLFLAVVFTSAIALADSTSYVGNTTSTVSILQRGARINQIVFNNAGAAASTITMYDCPTNVTTWVQGAYTNNVITTPTVVTTFTNLYGVVQNSTNVTFTSTLTPVSAVTNNYRTVLTITLPATSTTTYTPPSGLNVGFGLAAAASVTNVTATVNYTPTR